MNSELLKRLAKITPEEQAILDGSGTIEQEIYSEYREKTFTIDSGKLLEKGRLIEVRPHTRFIRFPEHKHNYIEIVYMCQGETTHIINGSDRITLTAGNLLFLNQHATHEILSAGENDIAVNFVVLPEFFARSISMIEQENVLRDFLISSVSGGNGKVSYLNFTVADILPVQNLIENMVWTIFSKPEGSNTINQTTMGLLLMNLSFFTDTYSCDLTDHYEQNLVYTVLKYIESKYRSGTLTEISAELNQPDYFLSRLLVKHMGKNFKELLQERRLQQAAYLLTQTTLTTEQIVAAIGYNNSSFFHRKFREKYGTSPKGYRNGGTNEQSNLKT